ncbi:MAG TPA: respiratory nitrate reductase subunit gamma [Gaiellaceae bacterium]|nr:respiratory nitrate reductase subunit gamma [Gaiellaceae bacterium]
MWNTLLFAVLPYVAVTVAVLGGIARYRVDRFSYSSQSSQFLEARTLFWGSVFWHYAILLVLAAHVLALMFWDPWAALVSDPTRLYVLEVVGLALSVLAFAGLAVLLARRLVVRRVTSVTTAMDWLLLAVLLAQVGLGIWIALGYRWGSDWYVYTAVPWLHSLVKLDPQVEYVVSLPAVVKIHALLGFGLVALFPFTRLVHVVTLPVTYLWRSYQLVVWNRPRAR